MAKIDDTIDAVSAGFQNVEVRSGTAWIPDEQMEQLGVRRKKAGEVQHKLWYLSIGETGQPPAMFWGHRFTDALKKAMKWRGMETKGKRGPRKAANGQATA
jgi:hypothetical protein